MSRNRRGVPKNGPFAIVLAVAGCFTATAWSAVRGADDNGLGDLIARLGAGNVPTGANVSVAQVEVLDDGGYIPDPSLPQFSGILFHNQSGPSPISSHAHQVARRFYGAMALTPGIDEVYLWEANHWSTNGFLRWGSGTSTDPLATPNNVKVFNHSWVGSTEVNSQDNEVLRRADFVSRRDDVLMVVGVNNEGGENLPILSHNFNGISVGILDGVHQSGNTLPGIDGPGRLKPEIVAEETRTSYATPFVAGAVALLTETARTTPTLRGINPLAERGEVLKAVILAGAQKNAGWTNNPSTSGATRGMTTQPIDTIYGVGWLDINLAHLILTGGEQDGSSTVPTATNISSNGWDFDAVDNDESLYYRFRVHSVADEVSVLATWHRRIFNSFSSWSLGDFELRLWRVDASNQLVPLIGNDGVGYFAGGNVFSNSAIDNIEHLYITGLEPANYVIELKRIDALGGVLDWDVAIAWRMPEAPACVEDLSGDGNIDVTDLFQLLAAWGPCSCPADLSGDGNVNVTDLFQLLAAWGPCS